MILNQQFDLIRQSPKVPLTDRIAAQKTSGHSIHSPQVGDPDLVTRTVPDALSVLSVQNKYEKNSPYLIYKPEKTFPFQNTRFVYKLVVQEQPDICQET